MLQKHICVARTETKNTIFISKCTTTAMKTFTVVTPE